ncbi:flagellar biosynthetic protein FliR, partial [Aeromonas veronii]|uniref:flagellar biosynthetic protein FliR n=1 Tax=Aeromonas veronii TaxID=654 RepID=UPI0038B64AD9
RFISCFVMLPVLSKQMQGGAMIRNWLVCSLALYAYPTDADTLPDQIDGRPLAMLITKEVLLGLHIGFVAAIPFCASEA